ncbi:hypothetical protein GTP77_29635, partial [Massilia sp. FT127W]|nr:hypothetical protein [Pseudoduganella aquatica]
MDKITHTNGKFIQLTYGSNGRVSTLKDTSSKIWTYGYNTNGMLTSVTAPVQSGQTADVRGYLYENADPTLLTGITINGVRYSTYSYYPDKRVSQSALAGGEESDSFVYGTNKTTVTNALGQPTVYNFTTVLGEQKISSVERTGTSTCGASSASTFYTAQGYIDYTLDWKGNRTQYNVDGTGRIQSVTTAYGTADALKVSNIWSGNQIDHVDFIGTNGVAYARTTYGYHTSGVANGRIASITMDDLKTGKQKKTTYAYTFNANGTIATKTITRTLPAGTTSVTTITYDAYGNIATRTNGLNQQESWSNYDGLGRPGTYTDINGVSTTMVFAPNTNLLSTTLTVPGGGTRTTTYTYNNNRQVTDINFGDGRVKRYRYNAATRLYQTGDALGKFETVAINAPNKTVTSSSERHVAAGSTPTASVSGSFSSTTALDSQGRPYTASGNAGQLVNYRYDLNGNVESVTDAASHVTRYEYDAQNRLTKSTAADGGVTTLSYDNDGMLESVQDPRLLTTTYTYNGFGDVVSRTSPDTGTTTYAYDSIGRLYTETRADNVTITYGWDKLDRPTTRTSPGIANTFTYDEGTYGKGRLTRTNDGTGQMTFTYNAAGELTSKASEIYGSTYTNGWTYDTVGRVSTMSYPYGLVLTYAYDSYGRVSGITSNLAGASATLATNFLYQPANLQRYAWRFGNGLPRLVTLDTDGRIAQMSSSGVHNVTLGYNNA